MRNVSAGPCPPRFVAFSHLPTSTSAKTLASPRRTTNRYRLVNWGNRHSPSASSLNPDCSWQPNVAHNARARRRGACWLVQAPDDGVRRVQRDVRPHELVSWSVCPAPVVFFCTGPEMGLVLLQVVRCHVLPNMKCWVRWIAIDRGEEPDRCERWRTLRGAESPTDIPDYPTHLGLPCYNG